MKNEIIEIINEIIKDDGLLANNLDLEYYRDNELEEETEIDEFTEYVTDRINEQEIIYYSNAIEFLSENDDSLLNSIELAENMGYELKNINSELLASLLLQNMLLTEFNKYI